MTPIPSDPLKRPPAELALGDGRKVKLKIPGLDPAARPSATEERDEADPPRDDPRAPVDPDAAGAWRRRLTARGFLAHRPAGGGGASAVGRVPSQPATTSA